MTDYGEDVLTTTDTVEGTWNYNGTEYGLQAEEITKGTLDLIGEYAQLAQQAEETGEVPEGAAENLDNFPWESDDSDKDFIESVISEKLLKPDVDPNNVSIGKLTALFEGLMETWQEGKVVTEAKEEMPIEGNR